MSEWWKGFSEDDMDAAQERAIAYRYTFSSAPGQAVFKDLQRICVPKPESLRGVSAQQALASLALWRFFQDIKDIIENQQGVNDG